MSFFFRRQWSPRPLPILLARRAACVSCTLGGVYLLDRTYNASSITRTLRTFYACALITADYKINFQPDKSDKIPRLHERVAERLFNLFTENGGIYIKLGQAIGANAALLPRPMQLKFSRLFDDAPQIPYSAILDVFLSELGRPPTGPEGIFDVFDENSVASASIAQVHKARLKSGEWVAVKVQKPAVAKQVEWDLGAYRLVLWLFENVVFDLPVYFVADFVSDHLRRELDFEEEMSNAQKTATLVASEPLLADFVYIPKVYPEYSTKRVMIAEWIDGVRLSDQSAIRCLMGESSNSSSPGPLAPGYDGPPLKGGVKAIMKIMVELFSAQIFSFGWVHCDPHPGNIIIRPHPTHYRMPQLVLIDHGLYVSVSETFRRQYATLWKGLLAMDYKAIESVTESWGIGAPDLFASATLLKPVKYEKPGGDAQVEGLTQYEQSVRIKAKLRSFLTDTDKVPKEIIFLGRNMRMVQGNNQSLGSPVNRIKITGFWASHSLTTLPALSLHQRLHAYWHHLVFRGVMISLDLMFFTVRARQLLRAFVGLPSEGFEDELERNMRGFAQSNLGVDVAPGAFDG